MLYCYISAAPVPLKYDMPAQHPHHHHHPGAGHPPATVSPSILRMSMVERLGLAAVMIAALWGMVFWAVKGAS
jgi:hypothetical protein